MNLALFLTLLVGLFILLGTLIGNSLKNNKKILDFSISMSFGVIIALSLLELFPEVVEHLIIDNMVEGLVLSLIGMLLGFFILYQLDGLIPHHEQSDHHHHHKNSNCHDEHLKHIGIVTSIALILHNIIEGMGIYIAATTELKVGLMLCIGVGLHNLPMGLVIESTLRNEYKWSKVVIISLVVSLATLLGGILACFIAPTDTLMGLLLATTLGMLIYISFVELLPQITNINDKKTKYIGFFSGIIILIISLIFG